MTLLAVRKGEKHGLPARDGFGYSQQEIPEDGIVIHHGDDVCFVPALDLEEELAKLREGG